MNSNHLKKFAQEARRKLLEQVGAKLNFVLTTDSAELREKTEQLKQLRQELGRTTKEQLIEKVAYTWFNRLMALRFMDVNDYQPLGIRMITPKDGYTIPELLDEAKRGNIPEELRVNRQKIYDLLDNKIPSTNPQNEAFKELLIATCNHLHTTFPFLFEKINDYTELLLPDDLSSDFSILKDVRDGMLIEDCKNVEIIGWLYQFYISEKKDEVFASKSKVKKEDIPAATQLFTPRWIVEYMVQNTLGKLWLQNRPKSKLREFMPYFIESESLTAEECLKIKSPEEIKFADPASGSGHIMVYAFELFTKIYEEEGYNTSDIPKLIIEKNLYGFEIDERAAQLSGIALMMKAREYQNRVFRDPLQPNIYCFQDLPLNNNEIEALLNVLQINTSNELMNDLKTMNQATNFGSLIIPHTEKNEIDRVFRILNHLASNSDIFQRNKIEVILNALSLLLALAGKYHCVVANPPYMGKAKMNSQLAGWTKQNFQKGCADLMTCFMERAIYLLDDKGFGGMINLPSWMFLSSFEDFRKELIGTIEIDTLLQFGRGIFGSDFGSVAFTLRKNDNIHSNGTYRRLFDKHVQVRSVETIERIFLNKSIGNFTATQSDFLKIPSAPIAYWLKKSTIAVFSEQLLGDMSSPMQGMATTNNTLFLRYWHEVNYNNLGLNCSKVQAKSSSTRWFPYNKGGEFRKWYGNQDYVVNYLNDGEDLKRVVKEKYRDRTYAQGFSEDKWDKLIEVWVLKNQHSYFKPSLSWSKVTAGEFSVRYFPQGFVFDVSGCSIFFDNEKDIKYVVGILNSKIAKYVLDVFSPTLNYEVEHIKKIPVLKNEETFVALSKLTDENIQISKEEWNIRETSWDFKVNELIKINSSKEFDLIECADLFNEYWKFKINKVRRNEEEINEKLIELYSLGDLLSSKVTFKDVTLLNDETVKRTEEIVFITNELIKQFVSYSVGNMFGRYSLDKEGIIIANLGETLTDYLMKIGKSDNECAYIPDEDNIIPVLEDEWFEDDITGRFYKFLKVSFGEKNFNKNLAFIEELIGKDIRSYFVKEFYPDHIKRYKKRPIYWMFSSPKGSFNVLIYMHRYTPDTVSNILNKYLKEFIGKLNTRKEHLERIKETGSASEKSKAIKESDNIQKMLVELHEYERDILYPLATERIEIDLDDGVLVNYNKFGKAIKEVNGLNDSTTKKRVKRFDWVNTTQIR